jgi:hypothetical protein
MDGIGGVEEIGSGDTSLKAKSHAKFASNAEFWIYFCF